MENRLNSKDNKKASMPSGSKESKQPEYGDQSWQVPQEEDCGCSGSQKSSKGPNTAKK